MPELDYWHYSMPYRMEHLKNSPVANTYLPLNRNYKPLNYTSREYVIYEDYINQAIVFARPLKEDEKFWIVKSSGRIASFHLYDDGSNTNFEAYLARINKLFSRKHRIFSSKQYHW